MLRARRDGLLAVPLSLGTTLVSVAIYVTIIMYIPTDHNICMGYHYMYVIITPGTLGWAYASHKSDHN